MIDLFARLYLDEDVSAQVGSMISARGFDVLSTVGAGNLGARDQDQLGYAIEAGRVFVTHNRRDFELLAEEWFVGRRHHAGIIIAVRRPARELTQGLLRTLNQRTREEFRDQLLYL